MTNYTGFIDGQSAFQQDGLALLLLQIFVILGACRLISIPFKYINQPSVIAEVIGGILLGPTALGRWSWFTNTIFPKSSLESLSVLSSFGLLLFLLLMGLELDLGVVVKRARISLTISLTGIISTFVLSIGVSRFFYLYIPGIQELVPYPKLLLFIGVAMSVTALPVLARILTEQRLLRTPVGVSVISAAAVDDAVGWMALALIIAIIAAATPLTGLYILLTVIGFAAFMFICVKPLLFRLHRYLLALRNQNANHEGTPISQPMVLVAFIVAITASFFTAAVGIHPIFGAFLTGLILPREDGFAVKLTEKIEEFTVVVLLPLYFTNSGLKTNIGAINSGLSVGALLLVIGCCCTGKIVGCSLAARVSGLRPRECLAVGVLMNTKGLVEIIILNIGLANNLINAQIFAIMILMAVCTTLMTTPLITIVYPESYHSPVDAKLEVDDTLDTANVGQHRRLLVCLPNTGSVATMMGLIHHITENRGIPDQNLLAAASNLSPAAGLALARAMAAATETPAIHAVRLRPLTDRMSAMLLASSDIADPSLVAFRTFGLLRGVGVTTHMVMAEVKDYARDVAKLAYKNDCDTIVLPWRSKKRDEDGNPTAGGLSAPALPSTPSAQKDYFSHWFGSAAASASAAASPVGDRDSHVLPSPIMPPATPLPLEKQQSYLNERSSDVWMGDLASQLLRKARVKVAILVDRSRDELADLDEIETEAALSGKDGLSARVGKMRRPSQVKGEMTGPPKRTSILVPFFGGPDDRAALQMAMRLASSSDAVISILHVRHMTQVTPEIENMLKVSGTTTAPRVSGETRNRRRIFSSLVPNNNVPAVDGLGTSSATVQAEEPSHPRLPPGWILEPVGAEDEKVLSIALGTHLSNATVNVHQVADGQTISNVEEFKPAFEDIEPINMDKEPSQASAAANKRRERNISTSSFISAINTTSPAVASPAVPTVVINEKPVTPEPEAGTAGQPSAAAAAAAASATVGVPFVRTLTTASAQSIPSTPKVSITEVVTPVDPLSTLLDLLRSPDLEAATGLPSNPTLVVLGHLGAGWGSAVAEDGGVGANMTVNGATRWSAHQATWQGNQGTIQGTIQGNQGTGQDTVTSLASLRNTVSGRPSALAAAEAKAADQGVEDRVLGVTASAIVRENVGDWDLLVVRKFRNVLGN
ncbi:K(+)/H(+) antiporter [Irineochytrium annulatum]|nr:K(+)/H(+) antiporter [Irineochytrium annulatum]